MPVPNTNLGELLGPSRTWVLRNTMKTPKGLTIKELREGICDGGSLTGTNKKTAILRIWGGYNFIEYPRSELRKVFRELEKRITVLQSGIEEPTATDRLLLIVLKSFAGDN